MRVRYALFCVLCDLAADFLDGELVSVMIVDEEPDILMLMRLGFEIENEGHRVIAEAATRPRSAPGLARPQRSARSAPRDPRQQTAGSAGLQVAAQMLSERPQQIIVLCSSVMNDDLKERAAAVGIVRCISKRDIDLLPALVHDLTA